MLAVAASCAMLAVPQAKADTLVLTGGVNFDTTSLKTAKSVTAFYDTGGTKGFATVDSSSDGVFAGFAGSDATMAASYTFNPSTPTPGLWSVGGYTFDLLTSTIVSQSSTFLNVSGTGTVTGPGGKTFSGSWTFTSSSASGGTAFKFGFQSTTTIPVPDGGSAVALLGIALTGIEAGRRLIRGRKKA